ncbi:MAG: FadR family transcriptional regulator [Actinobacteria bacterium]|nr:FadR family transcriptional regulator [Actinomycetota bacterium]
MTGVAPSHYIALVRRVTKAEETLDPSRDNHRHRPVSRGRDSLQTIARVPRSQLVRDQLQKAIDSGDFGPGEALPSERELVEAFQVSRVSVREAIRSLEAIGYVEVHQGRGSFVTKGPNDGYVSAFARWLALHKEEVMDLLKVRGALDELAAEGAAQGADESAIKRIQGAHDAFFSLAQEPDAKLDRLVQLDIAFHQAIAEASGSSLLMHLLQDLNQHLGESRKITLAPSGRPAKSAAEHTAIVQAINGRRPAEAKQAVATHLAAVRTSVSDFEAMKSAVAVPPADPVH